MAATTTEPEHGFVNVATHVGAPGSAVLALGADDDGDAVALWHVSPQGTRTGAWVFSQDEAFASKDTARQLVGLLERRALTARRPEDVNDVVQRLVATADLATEPWWERQIFSPMQAFGEIMTRRSVYESTVSAVRDGGRSAAPLEWTQDFAASSVPEEFEGIRRLSRTGRTAGTAVVAEALVVCRVLYWLVQVWSETEQVKNRRTYVRDAHGKAEALPPSWLAAVRTAGANRLPL